MSRGMTNSQPMIPRFFNPCEILLLELGGTDVPAEPAERDGTQIREDTP